MSHCGDNLAVNLNFLKMRWKFGGNSAVKLNFKKYKICVEMKRRNEMRRNDRYLLRRNEMKKYAIVRIIMVICV